MSRIRIIPVLLLENKGLYKTVQFSKPTYIGDPINAVKIFNDKEADELVLLDYTASRDRRSIDFEKIKEIAGEAFMPMAYGGGIQNFEDAKKVFDAGYEKVVLNSILFENPSLIQSIANVYGSQAVVASVDIRKNLWGKYKVYAKSGTVNTGKDPIEWVQYLNNIGVGEIMLQLIQRDGTWQGYDLEWIEKISNAISVPLIACSGAGSKEDFQRAIDHGASGVAAASMFVFQKKGMGVLISFPTNLKLTK